MLDTFLYADRHLLQQQPELASAEVYVHFNSSDEASLKMLGTLLLRFSELLGQE